MKNFTRITVFMLIIFTAVSCSGNKMDYSVIYKGKVFGKPAAHAKVINSVEEYNGFIAARAIKSKSPADNFDFSGNSLLLVYTGRNECAACGFEIITISECDVIKVEVKEAENAPKNYFIKIPKTEKKAELVILK